MWKRQCQQSILKNRLFPSCPKHLFQSEAECDAIALKFFVTLMQIKLIFTRRVLHLASFWKWEVWRFGNNLVPKFVREDPGNEVGSLKGPLSSMLEMFFHSWFSFTHCSQSYEHRALRDDTLKNGCESSAPCLVIFFYGKCLRVPWINCRCDF